MAYPNYTTTSTYQPTISDPLSEGARYGQAAGAITGATLSKYLENNKAEEIKDKAAQLIAEYNDPESKVFTGLLGSRRTLRLAQLLLPLDPSLSSRYETRAAEERTRDYGEAGVGSEKDAGSLSEIDGKIASIEAILAQRSNYKAPSANIADVPQGSIGVSGPNGAEGVPGATAVEAVSDSEDGPSGYPFRNYGDDPAGLASYPSTEGADRIPGYRGAATPGYGGAVDQTPSALEALSSTSGSERVSGYRGASTPKLSGYGDQTPSLAPYRAYIRPEFGTEGNNVYEQGATVPNSSGNVFPWRGAAYTSPRKLGDLYRPGNLPLNFKREVYRG